MRGERGELRWWRVCREEGEERRREFNETDRREIVGEREGNAGDELGGHLRRGEKTSIPM